MSLGLLRRFKEKKVFFFEILTLVSNFRDFSCNIRSIVTFIIAVILTNSAPLAPWCKVIPFSRDLTVRLSYFYNGKLQGDFIRVTSIPLKVGGLGTIRPYTLKC